MKKREKLTKVERSEISILLLRKFSLREIGRALGRSPNTISYEVRENSTSGIYDPVKANMKALVDRKYHRLNWQKIEQDQSLKTYIIEKLEFHWNPDEIAGVMKREKLPFYASKTAIYEWLRSGRGQQYCSLLYSSRYHKRPHSKNKTERVMIPERVSIDRRFLGATNRTRYGHWERDSIVSRKGCRGGLSVGSERKSRLITASKVWSMSGEEHAEIATVVAGQYLVKSNTFDNGIENKKHARIGVPSFFCDAYRSWQKGGVENANKMIRRYFPKGTNFREVAQREVDRIVSIINRKPRRILGYRSALEVASEHGVLLTNG